MLNSSIERSEKKGMKTLRKKYRKLQKKYKILRRCEMKRLRGKSSRHALKCSEKID